MSWSTLDALAFWLTVFLVAASVAWLLVGRRK